MEKIKKTQDISFVIDVLKDALSIFYEKMTLDKQIKLATRLVDLLEDDAISLCKLESLRAVFDILYLWYKESCLKEEQKSYILKCLLDFEIRRLKDKNKEYGPRGRQ